MATKKTKEINFEHSLEQLSKLVNKMEEGNLPLEQSLKYFEEGVGIIRDCQQALQKAEQKIQILSKEGAETLVSFSLDKEKENE